MNARLHAIRAISKLTGISVDRRAGWLTASAMATTSALMLAFQRSSFALSVAIMLLPLASLVGVIARAHRRAATFSRAEAWLVYHAFSAYFSAGSRIVLQM
jgi:hypothetical protein